MSRLSISPFDYHAASDDTLERSNDDGRRLFVGTMGSGRQEPPVAGYSGWWDSSDTVTIKPLGGTNFRWNDKSPNYNHFASGSSASYGSRLINGLNTFDFNGTGNGFNKNTAGTSMVNPSDGSWSVYVVALSDTTADGGSPRVIFSQDDFSAPRRVGDFIAMVNGGGVQAMCFNTAGTSFTDPSGSTLTTGVAFQSSAIRTATTLECWFNGSSNGSTAVTGTGPTAAPPPVDIGWRQYGSNGSWDGCIGEVLIFPTAHSSGDRVLMQNWLKAKWGTP